MKSGFRIPYAPSGFFFCFFFMWGESGNRKSWKWECTPEVINGNRKSGNPEIGNRKSETCVALRNFTRSLTAAQVGVGGSVDWPLDRLG